MKYMTDDEIKEGLVQLQETVRDLGQRSKRLAEKTERLKRDLSTMREMGAALNAELEQMKMQQAQGQPQ